MEFTVAGTPTFALHWARPGCLWRGQVPADPSVDCDPRLGAYLTFGCWEVRRTLAVHGSCPVSRVGTNKGILRRAKVRAMAGPGPRRRMAGRQATEPGARTSSRDGDRGRLLPGEEGGRRPRGGQRHAC